MTVRPPMHVFPGFLKPMLTQPSFESTDHFSYMHQTQRDPRQELAGRQFASLSIKPATSYYEVMGRIIPVKYLTKHGLAQTGISF